VTTLTPDTAFNLDGDFGFGMSEIESPFTDSVKPELFLKELPADFFPENDEFEFKWTPISHLNPPHSTQSSEWRWSGGSSQQGAVCSLFPRYSAGLLRNLFPYYSSANINSCQFQPRIGSTVGEKLLDSFFLSRHGGCCTVQFHRRLFVGNQSSVIPHGLNHHLHCQCLGELGTYIPVQNVVILRQFLADALSGTVQHI